jgi:hypothetical protein
MIGVGFIAGHLLARLSRKNDPNKVFDSIMTGIGLVLILGSRYHFFGG